MNRPVKFFSLSVLICLISLFMTIPVMAIPALPSSFYGTLKVNGENVPDGTLVQALINDQVVAQAYTQTYQADSVYALDVPGDDTDTSVQDGGRENDTIKFEIGGALADQTGTWNSGTNVNLNLTAAVVGGIAAAQATPSTVPTQTAIVLIQRSPTPTQTSSGIIQSSSIPTISAQPTLKATPLNQPSATPGSLNQSSPTSISPMNPGNGSSNTKLAVAVVGIVIVAAGSALFALRRRMDGVRKSSGSK
jgi:hypothetical protein